MHKWHVGKSRLLSEHLLHEYLIVFLDGVEEYLILAVQVSHLDVC